MRVLLSSWGSRGDVEPLMGLAFELRKTGVDVSICAPPDFADLAARVDVPLIPMGQSLRELLHGEKPLTSADAPRTAANLVAMQFETVGAAAEGCDAIVATGLMPAGVRSITQLLDIAYVCVTFTPRVIPSPEYAPLPRPGRPFQPGETDNRALWDVDAERVNALYRDPLNAQRAARDLPPVDDVRDHVLTRRPWLAADPVLAPLQGSFGFDVVQTGAWILPDERPLPDDLVAFLDVGAPPVFVGFSSVRVPAGVEAVAIQAIRRHGRRIVLGRGWADLGLVDDGDDCFAVGEVNQQALFRRVAAVVHHGGAGTTTTAACAGVPQVVVPQIADQPYWASRVADLGIGAAHDGPDPTVDSLAAALRTAFAQTTRARAADVAREIRRDGAAVAARRLVEEITTRRAGRETPASPR
ncbi:glycosyl transferase [Mycolicibacterium agri]|uniref:Glycosyl transferase n=1 Tax=Mycolicibacterium agri TaxID=36811 RepID=A0A2A7MQ85_MYCAG|nr:glycosyltransferase [Mycolicibacterium agri]PEG33846.1 glycosyl transferase [Mycolicibacterium agri]GFG52834.1 glycosyl transferase [Mycolicibacterium agri]